MMEQRVIERVFAAIGVNPDTITDELIDEWQRTLAGLSLDEVKIGVETCKAKGRTEPAAEFRRLCLAGVPDAYRPKRGDGPMARRYKQLIRDMLAARYTEDMDKSHRRLAEVRRMERARMTTEQIDAALCEEGL